MTRKDASLAPVPPSAMMIRLSPIAGIVMGLFLLSGLLCCLWSIVMTDEVSLLPDEVDWKDVRNGSITHRIAKELSAVPFARRAADLERAASWLAIGDTGARVRKGCAGWLFLADELTIHPHADANAARRAEKVVQLRDALARRNIRLVVAVVPDKSRIVDDQLCGVSRSPRLAERVHHWQAGLVARKVTVLDLAETMKPVGDASFLKTDTHWSEAGARAAARAIATAIETSGFEAVPRKLWRSEAGAPEPRPGDLVRLAGLDWLPSGWQPAGETAVTSRFSSDEAEGVTSADDLFGDAQLPNVALVGTSFSRNSNFAAFLEQALRTSVGNFAKDGGEFSGSLTAYLGSVAFRQTPPALLIWEINERDLQKPYREDIALPD